ncbi:MAG: hypothetical protein NZ898_16350, partial [Myxococcota bacterium]|nr:hypothetical protein [Myxococcota bacterium]
LAEVRVTPPRRARLVVDGTLTRFERAHEGDDVEVRCAVSLVVHDARAGAVRAVLTGRAGARAARDSEALRRVALRAAIRGALRGLSQLTAIP